MLFRQGTAPAILYRDGKKVFEFNNGMLETEDLVLIAVLLEKGAIDIDGKVNPRELERFRFDFRTIKLEN